MLLTKAPRLAACIAAVAAVALAASGCSPLTSASTKAAPPAKPPAKLAAHHAKHAARARPAPARHAHPASTAARQQADTLVTEPSAGFSPVYGLIGSARHSIDITMYEFADTTAEADLAAAARRGVHVEVILDQREKSEDQAAYQYLQGHGIKVTWSSPSFTYTHQKTVIIDGTTAVIMTANLTSSYYPTSRDFLVIDTSRADVAAITAVFTADFAHRSVQPGDGSGDLVWSPTNAQARLLGLINGATRSLRIYSEEMGDTAVEDALIAAARRGVDVQVCGENESGEYDSAYARLARAGVHISYYGNPDGFYIHGKVIEADYGTSHAKVFIGSENFSSTSLNRNRELGIITSAPAILSAIAIAFAGDFQRGTRQSLSQLAGDIRDRDPGQSSRPCPAANERTAAAIPDRQSTTVPNASNSTARTARPVEEER
jgi:phosphatidylserine/phosphatidylglycerophosphate/cardiolipin synthase-like enzyme